MYYYGGYLMHHGIKGQKWGIRRFQNEDGSLTPEGQERYNRLSDDQKRQFSKMTPKQRAGILSRDNSVSNKSMGELSPEQRRQRVGNFLKGLGIVLGAAAVGYAGYKGVQYYQGKQKEMQKQYSDKAKLLRGALAEAHSAQLASHFNAHLNREDRNADRILGNRDAERRHESDMHNYMRTARRLSIAKKQINSEYNKYKNLSEATPGVRDVIDFIRNKGKIVL